MLNKIQLMLATCNCWNLLDISPKLCKLIIPPLVEIIEYNILTYTIGLCLVLSVFIP